LTYRWGEEEEEGCGKFVNIENSDREQQPEYNTNVWMKVITVGF